MEKLNPALEAFLASDEYTNSQLAFLLKGSDPYVKLQDKKNNYYSLACPAPIHGKMRDTTEQLDIALNENGDWLASRTITKKKAGLESDVDMTRCYLLYRKRRSPC